MEEDSKVESDPKIEEAVPLPSRRFPLLAWNHDVARSIFDSQEYLAPFESKSHFHDIVSQLQALVHLETHSFCRVIDMACAGLVPVVPEISDQNGRLTLQVTDISIFAHLAFL